jgi:hypothetical protein
MKIKMARPTELTPFLTELENVKEFMRKFGFNEKNIEKVCNYCVDIYLEIAYRSTKEINSGHSES